MVIQKFNRIIRNKWIWGAFAFAISAVFAFDFLLADLQREDDPASSSRDAGTLAGEKVDAKLFLAIAEDVRGFGAARAADRRDESEINREAWEQYAALKTAEKLGLAATDEEVAAAIRRDPTFQVNGAFSFAYYERLLRENGLTPERFEASLRRRMTRLRVERAVLGSAAWVSPMALDQALDDMTDTLTVKVARFKQDAAKAKAVTLDDAGLRAWYDANTNDLFLAERTKIRYLKYEATAPAVLAKMAVTEDEMRDRYDATLDRYTTTDTNGVETVKAFDEVKGEVEKDLRTLTALEFYETNLNFRAYATRPATPKASRLDEIAKEDNLRVQTSPWFALDGSFKQGFMVRASQVLPKTRSFIEAVSELDPESEDLRYGVVSSDTAVYLVEIAAKSPAHVPTFDEAKDVIRPRALEAAREKAFKAEVEAVAKKGRDAVLASGDVSTNLVFAVVDLKPNQFADQNAVARAAATLAKGEISDFVPTGSGRGLLVVCEDRAPGDAAKAMILKSQVQNDFAMLDVQDLLSTWPRWNLERLGFTTGDLSSVDRAETDEE